MARLYSAILGDETSAALRAVDQERQPTPWGINAISISFLGGTDVEWTAATGDSHVFEYLEQLMTDQNANPSLYCNDTWTIQDDFGMAGLGDRLARLVLDAPPPFSVRVTGKWGAGKTSVLRRAFATLGGQPVSQAVPLGEERLDEPEKVDGIFHTTRVEELKKQGWTASHTNLSWQCMYVWYSPWQHQSSQNPLIPLLQEIRDQFTAWTKIKEIGKNFNRRGVLAGLTLMERVVDGAVSIFNKRSTRIAEGVTKQVREAWRDAAPILDEPSDGQRFHLLFEDAVDNLLVTIRDAQEKEKNSNARLVIFIDDLDRCEEHVVVDLLECIKLYLSTNNCVFVFGMDDTAVLGALERHWPQRSHHDNREYLEKLFQATLSVPLPRVDRVTGVIANQLRVHGFPKPDELAGHIEKLLEPNPRKIKNFTNSLCAGWGGSSADPNNKRKCEKDDTYAVRYVMVHYLRLFHRPVWRLIERQHWIIELLHRVLANNTNPIQADGVEDEAQAVAREFLVGNFSHVLENIRMDSDNGGDRFRNMSMDKVVDEFLKRLDQKRSDEYFRDLFIEHFQEDATLHESFFYLDGDTGGRA